jgi:RNA polymerase sigma factor (sigma-70 family)
MSDGRMLFALTLPIADPAPKEGVRDIAVELRPLVRAVIASILHEPPGHPDVDDALSETMKRALEHPERFQDAANARGYLVGIARFVALDVIRARKKGRRHDSLIDERGSEPEGVVVTGSEEPADERIDREDQAARVRAALLGLPENQRDALRMFHMEGLEYQAIASKMNVPLGTVATWVSRGRQKLSDVLSAENAR